MSDLVNPTGKANTVLIEAERAAMFRSLILTAQKNVYARRRSWFAPYENVRKHFGPNQRKMNRDTMRMLHYVLTYSDPNPDLVKSHAGRQKWRQQKNNALDWLEMSIEDTGDKNAR
jgi:hypothetical protein